MSPERSDAWRVPSAWVLLVAVALIACAEVGGASMVQFRLPLTRWARGVMLERPATHGLVGVRDVDEQILDEALVKFDAGLRLFHLHAEGMGTVIIVAAMVATTLVEPASLARAIVVLVTVGGALYPAGYLLWSGLIPFYGVDTGRRVAEWLVWIPFGGASIVAVWLLTAALAARLLRRRAAAVALVLLAAGPAAAHHVGAWSPRDNEVSANFKQIKLSLQARKFDVALRLYEGGALRRDLRARAASLPAGLDAGLLAALGRGDAPEAERGLMVFFAALVRDLADEAARQLADASAPAAARAASGQKFLEAIWRYYNLIDFAVAQRDPRASAAIRLAFDEAEGYVKAGAPPAPDKLRAPLARIASVLGGVIEASPTSSRRDS